MEKVKQVPVFLQAYIVPDQEEALKIVLGKGGNPSKPNHFFDLSRLETVHFSRWIIAPADGNHRASVIYSGNVDGTVNQHLDDLAEHFFEELDQVFGYCEGYPEKASLNKTSRLAFLKSKSQNTPAFYVGAPGRSVAQIRNEAKLHEALKHFVQENGTSWKSDREAYKAIQRFVKDDPQWDWARKHYQSPRPNILNLIVFGLFVLTILPLVLVGILLVFLTSEIWDKKKQTTVNSLPVEHIAKLKAQEDFAYQNQLSQVFVTKKGIRKLMLHFMLWVTNFLAKNFAVEGQLMGTPTIHFARWVFIDNGKRFVFFSNFDGSFTGYLGDFVDNNGWGLNAIYGAAKGYPRTWFLFTGGAYKIAKFMGWGRATQIVTPIWYSAYPWDGLQQIVSRSRLREALFNSGNLTPGKIKDLLRRI